jgi:hypothetical protein
MNNCPLKASNTPGQCIEGRSDAIDINEANSDQHSAAFFGGFRSGCS